jgi:predicted metal-dependent hydrolase
MLVSGVYAEVLRKSMKNIIIKIKSPDGQVQVSAPLRMEDRIIENFILSRIDWIRKHQERMKLIPRVIPKNFESDEVHYFLGKKFQLQTIPSGTRSKVVLNNDIMELHVAAASGIEKRKQVLDNFYRKKLKEMIPQMISDWEARMNVKVNEFGVKSMKTRWGTCNIRTQRIWLNLELAKKPVECLEHIVVHEMVHLLERNHTKRFYALMDRFLPDWRRRKEVLDKFPIGHEEWEY